MTDKFVAFDRKRLHNDHVKHARIWQYKPMNWHSWKFHFWPDIVAKYEDRKEFSESGADALVIVKAADKQTFRQMK